MGSNHCTEPIREHRSRRADGGEPLNDEHRTVVLRNTSLYANITEYAAATHDIDAGDQLIIETYPDGVWIQTSTGGHDGDE